ncbi:hypothetical protein KR059_009501 [Drosophila kikkawai]|nr:hypothetical protein KR059_009501 [Drosophila kikkawai]
MVEHVANIGSAVGRRPLGSGNCNDIPDISHCNVHRLKHELKDILANPPPYCCVSIKALDLTHWVAIINGPIETVYEGGHFRLDINFPSAYPFKPPMIRFVTRVYHCNVDKYGAICMDLLRDRWSPIITVSKVLLSIYLLMGDCNPDDPLDSYVAEMYKTNRLEHDRVARYWTEHFAKPEAKKEDDE